MRTAYTIIAHRRRYEKDRTLGEISISKVDLDAVRYVGGSAAHGTALASRANLTAMPRWTARCMTSTAAEDITHPDGP